MRRNLSVMFHSAGALGSNSTIALSFNTVHAFKIVYVSAFQQQKTILKQMWPIWLTLYDQQVNFLWQNQFTACPQE